MKSFFKGLSLVLAALMVVTAVPARQTKAADALNAQLEKVSVTADGRYQFVEDKAWAIGTQHKVVIAGTGLSSEDAAKQTITSSDDKVIKVVDGAKGTIEVVGYGTARLTVKAGTFTDEITIGIFTKSTFTVKQTSYKDVSISFATAEAAAAALKNGVTVKRVVKTPEGVVYEIKASNVSVVADSKDKTKLVATNLTNNAEYSFYVGNEKPEYVAMSVGAPVGVIFSDLNVAVKYEGTDLEGEDMGQVDGDITITVVDADGKILRVDGSKIRVDIAYENDVNANFIQSEGVNTITFIAAEDGTLPSIDIIANVFYKENDDDDNDEPLFTQTQTYEANKYNKPSFKGNFVYAVGLVNETGADKDKVNAAFITDFNQKVTLNASDKRKIVFYFVADDGKNTKYTADGNLANLAEIKELDDDEYFFWYKLEENKDILSLDSDEIVAYQEGKETILIYMKDLDASKDDFDADKEANSQLMGIINVEVAALPYVKEYNLSKKSLKGYAGSCDTTEKITFQFKDQNGNVFANDTFTLTDEKGQDVSVKYLTAESAANMKVDADGKGSITFNYSALAVDTTVKLRFRADNALKTSMGEQLSITLAKKPTSTSKYKITASDVKVNNKVATSSDKLLGATISVMETKGDANIGKVTFGVFDQKDISKIKGTDIASVATNNFYLMVLDPSGNPVPQSQLKIASTKGTGIATVSTANVDGTNVIYLTDLCVDLWDETETATQNMRKNVKFGTYTVVVYQCTATNNKGLATFSKKTETTFTVSEVLENINVNAFNNYAADDKTGALKVDADDKIDLSTITGATEDELVKNAILAMAYALDTDSDGKFVTTGEIGTLGSIIDADDIELKSNNRSYILGADGASVYLKNFDITVMIPASKVVNVPQVVTYTVEINKTIVTGGVVTP